MMTEREAKHALCCLRICPKHGRNQIGISECDICVAERLARDEATAEEAKKVLGIPEIAEKWSALDEIYQIERELGDLKQRMLRATARLTT